VVSNGRYNTSDDCLGVVAQSSGSICVTSWWPLLCGDQSQYTCVGFNRYPNVTACGGEDASTFSATAGYCVTNWWPMTCGLVSAGNCTGWYPPGGYATSDACTGSTGSGDDKSQIENQIKADVKGL